MAPSAPAKPARWPTNGKSQMETTLQRIWAQCLGVGSIDRNANFFELGGDSLIAISVAMTAANEGLDLTPQDLYENQTVAALAKALVARYAAGGLARQSPEEVEHPPVPPNVAHFLEHGLREAGRWRIPLILQLRPDVPVEDVRSVLTAVTNHHDALRLRIVQRAGTWEQHVGEPAGVHRTGHSVASRRARTRKPAGAGGRGGHPKRADPSPGPVEPAADRHLYQWPAGRSVLPRDQCAWDRGRQRVA